MQNNTDFSARSPIAEGVDVIIAQRYSPRAFKPANLSAKQINTLFDAARLAPSCFNEQPWQFYASAAGSDSFDKFLGFLVPFNRDWAKNASLITIVTASKTFEKNDKPNDYALFDCGAAWFALTYQARTMGLHTHAMAGIEKQAIIDGLNVPDSHEVVCAIAIGELDQEQAKDEEISARKSLNEILTII